MSAEYNFRFRIDWNVPRFDLDLTAGYIGAVKVLGIPVAGQITQAQIDAAVAAYIEAHPGSLSPLSPAVKAALLQIAQKVAYIDEDGQDYYDALYEALYARVLVSITATYTQSGTVYDTDSLDSLKSDLVVVANYNDGTTETLASTDYTLSGTLTAGTSTVTVTYEDKTTTFIVTVTADPFPSTLYTAYDYICTRATSGTLSTPTNSLIKTASYANLSALSAEFWYEAQSGHYNGSCIFGKRTAEGSGTSYAFYTGSSTGLGYHLHGNDSNPKPSAANDTVNHVVYTNTSSSPSSLKVNDGDPVSVVWSNTNTITNVPFTLLTNPKAESGNFNLSYKTRIGRIILRDLSGTIVGDYRPCVRIADNVIGIYDVIEQAFHTCVTTSAATTTNSSRVYNVGNWS